MREIKKPFNYCYGMCLPDPLRDLLDPLALREWLLEPDFDRLRDFELLVAALLLRDCLERFDAGDPLRLLRYGNFINKIVKLN